MSDAPIAQGPVECKVSWNWYEHDRMSNKELVEMAARAIGIVGMHKVTNGEDRFYYSERSGYWRPLTDDGDAFRLAISIGMSIYAVEDGDDVTTCSKRVGWTTEDYADHNGDRGAATRRAIVRAAAIIGTRMTANVEVSGLRGFSRSSARL